MLITVKIEHYTNMALAITLILTNNIIILMPCIHNILYIQEIVGWRCDRAMQLNRKSYMTCNTTSV